MKLKQSVLSSEIFPMVISCHKNLTVSQILELALTLFYCSKMLLLFSKLPGGVAYGAADQWACTIMKVTELMDKRKNKLKEWELCKMPWQHNAQVSRMNVLRNTCVHWAVTSCEPWYLICSCIHPKSREVCIWST